MGTFCRKAAAGGATPREQEPGPPRGNRARTRFELDYWYVMARVETTADDEVASSTSGRARSVVGNTLSVTVAPFAAVAERTRTLAGEATGPLTLMLAALTAPQPSRVSAGELTASLDVALTGRTHSWNG